MHSIATIIVSVGKTIVSIRVKKFIGLLKHIMNALSANPRSPQTFY
jgi:hypothetical protein